MPLTVAIRIATLKIRHHILLPKLAGCRCRAWMNWPMPEATMLDMNIVNAALRGTACIDEFVDACA